MPTIPNNRTFSNTASDILNAIRNEASINYQNYVPEMTPGSDVIRTIGAVLMDNTSMMNEFLTALVNRIAKVYVTSRLYRNPLAGLKKGILDYGETVEDIFIAMAQPFEYDPEDAQTTLYKRYTPDVKSAFYHVNYRKFYPVTVQEADLRRAFLSESALLDFLEKIIEQLYTGMNYDEFITTKYMIAKKIHDGQLKTVQIDATNAKDIATKIKGTINKLSFMSTEYNIAGVETYSDRSNIYVLVNSDFDAILDVDVLAYAFNMDRADIPARKIVIDSFGSLDIARLNKLFSGQPGYYEFSQDELTALDNIPAVIMDENFLMIFDVLIAMRDAQNGKGLYTNYFLHNWKTFAVSPFAPAAVLTSGAASVTDITVTPSAITVAAGGTAQFEANVTTENFGQKSVTWTVDSNEATINAAGLLTLTLSASGEIIVTATSVADPTKSATATVTVG